MPYHPNTKWKYYHNLWPFLLFLFRKPNLSSEGRRVLAELNEKGIAITSCDQLLGKGAFERLRKAVEQVKIEKAREIEAARNSASDEQGLGVKNYALFLLNKPALTPTNPFVEFALQPEILGIANSYMRMFSKLWYFNIWQTFVTQAPAKESQLWHVDYDDRMVLKCFVYISEVDDGAGPFSYAPRTHSKIPNISDIERIPGKSGRSSDEQMSKLVPASAWVQGVGPAGTMIFADTSGYHKGGLCRRSERVMFDCMFTSQAARRPESYARVPIDRPTEFPKAFALSPSNPKFVRGYLEKINKPTAQVN